MKRFEISVAIGLCLLLAAFPLQALKTDRQQPLEVNADSTDGTLGDGLATLQGQVEIRQGTLFIRADVANVTKTEGRVRHIELTGAPVHLEQEIANVPEEEEQSPEQRQHNAGLVEVAGCQPEQRQQ